MAVGVYRITEMFEQELSRYTGAPHVVAVDSCTSALMLCLHREMVAGTTIDLPSCTYMSVPCAVIQAGARIRWRPSPRMLLGAYRLGGTRIVDSALSFTAGMYWPGALMCLSFSGPNKRLKLGKAGAILCDNAEDAAWFRRARFSGRRECSYHDDTFDMLGWNVYLLPDIAARGLALMAGFWGVDGEPIHHPDIVLPYPDLSRHPAYAEHSEWA